MAGESPQKKQVPKVFTEKAKMAAMEAQARMDLMKAQSDAAFNVNKAKQKAMATRAQFMGSQMDSQRQAAADRQAAGPQEPVGMEDWSPAPMPDPRAPSSSLMGATGPDISSILTPQSVQGGAGIQAATGGMGRAEPGGGVDPAQLQGQVNPYNVSQSTVNRTVPVQMGGGVLNVPQTATETQVQPNQLSPYELGQLQEANKRTGISQQRAAAYQYDILSKEIARGLKTNSALLKDASTIQRNKAGIAAAQALTASRWSKLSIDQYEHAKEVVKEYGTPLADLYALGLEGMPKEEFNRRKMNILGSIPDPELRVAAEQYAQRHLSTVQADRSLRGSGLAITTNPDGGVSVIQGNSPKGIQSLMDQEMNTQRTLSFRKLQSAASGIDQSDKLIGMLKANPTLAGAAGTATRLSTELIGAFSSFVPTVSAQLTKDLNDAWAKTAADPAISQEQKLEDYEVYKSLLTDFKNGLNPYAPGDIGKLGVMVNALRATLAKAELGGELNIRGYEALGHQFVSPTGMKGTTQAVQEIESLKERFQNLANQGRADYVRMGGSAALTTGQILGLEPMPAAVLRTPEVTAADIYGGARILAEPPPGAEILRPEDLQ